MPAQAGLVLEFFQRATLQSFLIFGIFIRLVGGDMNQPYPRRDTPFVREYVDSETYTGPTKKGVRFAWDKLTEFIGLLETQARQLGSREKAKPALFTDAHPSWVKDAEEVGADKRYVRDLVLQELLPEGPKVFPGEFLDSTKKTVNLELPAEPIF
jgi:hypothetical protein